MYSLVVVFLGKRHCNAHLIIGAGETAFFFLIRAPIRSVNDTTLFTLLVDDPSIALDDDAAVRAQGGIERLVACWVIALDCPVFCLQRELILRHRIEWLELGVCRRGEGGRKRPRHIAEPYRCQPLR